MDKNRLREHVENYARKVKAAEAQILADMKERAERKVFFQSATRERMLAFTPDEFGAYINKLWAMLVWGNRQYRIDKIIAANGFEETKAELAELVWGAEPLVARWDRFRSTTKQIGPAMMAEILAHVHPTECMVWNRRAYVGLDYLCVPNLPKYNHQATGDRYVGLCAVAKSIAETLRQAGVPDPDLLTVDYFIWDELQVLDNLSSLHRRKALEEEQQEGETDEAPEFVHNEIRDKLVDIGSWLGFAAATEKKVATGAVVDAVWEASIGNMGKVIYVFEVQTKGSSDSLLLNLLRACNNAAVQGVVAVSDETQLEVIGRQAENLAGLGRALRLWDYREVLAVHESLEMVNEVINKLKLVPASF